jgi:hypothetical protein
VPIIEKRQKNLSVEFKKNVKAQKSKTKQQFFWVKKLPVKL